MDYAVIERINAELDRHFKSNGGNWFAKPAYDSYYNKDDKVRIDLRNIWGETKVAPWMVALHILRTEPGVRMVLWGTWIFTRETLRDAGHKC